MPGLTAARGRMPLVAFILLVVLCLLLLGFACACFSDQPMQAVERAVAAGAAVPAVIEVWSLVGAAAASATLLLAWPRTVRGRASPALLQRFLF